MLIAVGLAVGFRANVWNIGAEGQYIMGAVAASGIALFVFGEKHPLLVPLMLVYISQLGVSWLVHGPWRDPEGFNFPQTKMFEDAALLPMLVEGTRLNAAFLLALGTLLAGYVFMH